MASESNYAFKIATKQL